ncbi:hypothetical protein [Fundicoccus culcitae]|uniref:Uncharacterized protein n=1 Tax=Fundicoccus culcitae TaxID=2969821 RepID=A0ABY5P6Q3_9LACT|nr:hypothetical protein [Fundicoccus culcitae]UUX34416.1 hypothetical protein NRE15_01850 [Fundicoccus culcitae]
MLFSSNPGTAKAESFHYSNDETQIYDTIYNYAYVQAQYRVYQGPTAYVRQRINGIDYGGFVPWIAQDSMTGLHIYGGRAPMIGADPYRMTELVEE